MKPSVLPCKQESGYMLLEVLIAMLVFSIGILGLINLQAVTMINMDSTRLRGVACVLADELVGSMRAGDHSPENLLQMYSSYSEGPGYTAWLDKIKNLKLLPGVTNDENHPMVQITTRDFTDPFGNVSSKSLVTIVIYWQLPSERDSNTLHSYTAINQITP